MKGRRGASKDILQEPDALTYFAFQVVAAPREPVHLPRESIWTGTSAPDFPLRCWRGSRFRAVCYALRMLTMRRLLGVMAVLLVSGVAGARQ